MTKLCARGKAAAKRKFKVYPSAYANAYASKICAGKIKDPSGVKRKDFKGPKPAKKGAMIKASEGKDIEKKNKVSLANKLPTNVKKKKLGFLGKRIGAVGVVATVGSMLKNLGEKAYTAQKAGQYRKEKKPTATFQKRSTKKQQIRDQKSERFIKDGNTSTSRILGDEAQKSNSSDSYEFSKGGFNKVSNHEVMGSQLVGEIDGQPVSAKGSLKYYEDLL